MTVYQEDIDSGTDPLPVRQGCSLGPCACSGYCKIIIGYIARKKYLDFIEKFVPIDSFIETNLVRIVAEEDDPREV